MLAQGRIQLFVAGGAGTRRTTLDLPLSHVFGVARSTTLFLLQPPARYPLHVCTNLGCTLRGGHDVLRTHLEKRLGIEPGQTTPDGLFRSREEDGLGGCAYAPTMTCGSTITSA